MSAQPPHPADRIEAARQATGSSACVGLDPRPALIPPPLRRAALERHGDTPDAVADAFVAYNRAILDAVAGRCAAVKAQAACYEAYGSAGWRALEQTVTAAVERDVPVVVDAKRNDIGSTATHYAEAIFGGAPGLDSTPAPGVGGAWLTVNGYLGTDGIEPFLTCPGRGVFVLVHTSNPSAAEVQDQATVAGRTVAEQLATLVAGWGEGRLGRSGLSDVGAVVGATWPAQARRLRELMPDTLFLVPGYGTQGGSALDAVAGRRPGSAGAPGVLINSSRQILSAWQQAGDDDWAGAARRALERMNAEIDAALAASATV